MRKWRRPSFALVALLALFASLLPSWAFACPITGRVADDAATLCQGMTPAQAQQCAARMAQIADNSAGDPRNCCQQVPLLPSQDDEKRGQLSLTAHAAITLDAPAPVAASPGLFALAAEQPALAAPVRAWLARFLHAPPPRSQHRPVSLAGRAPPVL